MKKLTRFIIVLLTYPLVLTACQTATSGKQKPMIIAGDIDYKELTRTYPYFQAASIPSQESTESIETLKAVKESTRLTVYFGVWCHDSVREVPALIRLLGEVNNPMLSYQLIALDMKKQDPQGRAEANDIKYTPTIVVYQADKELGRIIEKPEQDLATDLVRILSENSH